VTQPQPTAGPPDRLARSRGPLVAAAIVIAFIVVGAILAWVLFIRSDAPPEVGLSSSTPGASAIAASPSAAASSGGSAPSGSAVPSGAPTSSPASGSGGEGISGTWTVDPSIGSFSDFSGSFVGYRIDEQLAGIGANTAVGRTPNVTGSMTVDGTTVTVATFSADLTTLQSDDARRDGQLRQQGLETGTYPTATFTLTQPIELGQVPSDGQVIQATATGDLTLHGQTRSVDVPLQAKIDAGVITVTGTLPVVLTDYGMQAPRSFAVLSVADQGTMELQLQLIRG
jgi:polyisoprenoid-binding protein YceI